jgi:short subunit dehydrogenase-like uncharacterized protein
MQNRTLQNMVKRKNMVLATNGPYKDENRPITHVCCYTFTPYNRDLPKILIFAQAHWDGHAKIRMIHCLRLENH